MTTPTLVEHFFRHEYGRLVATLSRRVGVQHIGAVEDAAQSALMTALERWTVGGVPDEPSRWLFRVAHNRLIGALRKQAGRRRILAERADEAGEGDADAAPEAYLSGEVGDDLLRMLFVCCDDAVPADSQLVIALKTLCGFGVREIALRLFTTEANVYKRLGRARQRLRDLPRLGEVGADGYASRLPRVREVLYLLFTEGHLSAHEEVAIRRELCQEAIRLATLLAEHPVGQTPETFALVALMHLHVARLDARQDGAGGLLLLSEQDRTRWDQVAIEAGLSWLSRSAEGRTFSRYHAEAGIAAEHCLAPSLADTRWDRIVRCYALLQREAPSPLHELGRAVAVAEWKGPAAGLAVLEELAVPTWLEGSYLWSAVAADLYRRAGDAEAARGHRERALQAAPSPAIRTVLTRRLAVD